MRKFYSPIIALGLTSLSLAGLSGNLYLNNIKETQRRDKIEGKLESQLSAVCKQRDSLDLEAFDYKTKLEALNADFIGIKNENQIIEENYEIMKWKFNDLLSVSLTLAGKYVKLQEGVKFLEQNNDYYKSLANSYSKMLDKCQSEQLVNPQITTPIRDISEEVSQ